MSDENEPFRRLHDLAAAELDGAATPAQQEELRSLLGENADSRRLYVEYIQDTAGLRWSFAHTTIPVDEDELVAEINSGGYEGFDQRDKRATGNRFTRFRAYWAIAAAALIGSGFYLFTTNQAVENVAVLTRSANAVWEGEPVRELERLHVGQALQLKSGQIELMFDTGVEVVLHGPAHFEVRSADRAFSSCGTISARVGPAGKGFTIDTPSARVIDLGTEFGMAISPTGETEVAVFLGKVDLAVGESPKKRLDQGEGIRVDANGRLDRLTSITSDRFPVSAALRPGIGPDTPIIANVTDNIRVGESNKFYRIVRSGLHEDSPAFVDRNHQWNAVEADGLPIDLDGAEYVMPFNDDKFHEDLEVAVDLTQPANLYVFYSDSMTPPDWLVKDFVNTGFDVGLDEEKSQYHYNYKLGVGAGRSVDTVFSVWKQEVRKPRTVRLGAVKQHRSGFGYNMYGIATTPLGTGGMSSNVQ